MNCVSVKLATAVQNVFCFCKLLAIGIIIGGGLYRCSLVLTMKGIMSKNQNFNPDINQMGNPSNGPAVVIWLNIFVLLVSLY